MCSPSHRAHGGQKTDPLAWLLLGVIALYRWTLSPLFGGRCRYLPSCSRYAEQALRTHGGRRGGWLALRRLFRCHPWGGWGYDPVPPERAPSHRSAPPPTTNR